MRILLFIFLTLTSFSASAISDQDLYDICLRKGIDKLIGTEVGRLCKGRISLVGIKAQHIDNRWWNPSSYIDYAATLICEGEDEGVKVSEMVQYASGECI